LRDLDQLAQALRSVLPGGKAITAISPLTTGYSNETYLIEGPNLILRLPPAGGAMLDGHDVITQARIYEELGKLAGAPPVPRVVTKCSDIAILGVPFFVMERVEGDSIDDIKMCPWFIDGTDAFRRQICRDWVSVFAGLAKLPPMAVLGGVLTPEDDARTWRGFARSAGCPKLEALFDRLLSIPAPLSGPPAIIHGDTKLSNIMWRDGSITAVLDWELALNGEPLANLAYMLYAFENKYHAATRAPKLPGMLSRDEVIALWSEVSGRSAKGLFWHEIAQIGKLAAIVAEATNMYETGRSLDPKLAIFKQSLGYYLGVMQAMLDGGGFPETKETP
jgi:aminoglycoside phosphotransferase (APT) family kinase protein